MKTPLSKLNLLWVAVLLWSCLAVSAEEKYTPFPPELDGSMMPIDFAKFSDGPSLPDSLQPVYAAYVSRHGARYLSGPKKTESLIHALSEGESQGSLSETGKRFLALLREIERVNAPHWGDLSPLGIEEQHMMGQRVFKLFDPLHNKIGARTIYTFSSYMPRCVMTMYQFTWQLIRENDELRVVTDEGHKYDGLLCCFMTAPKYSEYRKDGDWKAVYDDFVERHISPEPAELLFVSTDMDRRQLQKMTLSMYEVLKGNRAAGLPAPTTEWMSVKQYRACWEADNLNHYLRNNITPLSSLAARATAPLLFRLIQNLDHAARAHFQQPILVGYFGHAETLLPLLSLLRVQGCYALPLDYDSLSDSWKVQDITPLGANVIFLLCRSNTGRNYVVMELNGRRVSPMPGAEKIVAWDDLRDYWLSLLKSYGVEENLPLHELGA